MGLSSKEKKELAKQRKENAKQALKYRKEQEKAKKSSEKKKKKQEEKPQKPSASKIEEAINSGKTAKFQKLSREDKFRMESEEKIRNLKPQDFDDGYYIDEYSEKKRREKRAKVIRQQETETIRRNKKPMTHKQVKVRRILILAATLITVLAIGAILSFTVLFKTENIEVEGCSYYYDDQIIGYSNVALQQNIFIAKMNSTPQDIVDNFAYVDSAKVDFVIPDTIRITITDAVPAYYMTEGNNFLLISAKGRILERVGSKPENLPELICGNVTAGEVGTYLAFEDPTVPEVLQNVAKSLADNEFGGIVGFDVTNTSAVKLDYEGRIKIDIGVAEDIDYKLRTAQAIITGKLDPNNTGNVYGTLDVSTCSKNKMSRYVPGTAPAQPVTQPATDAYGNIVPQTTQPATDAWGNVIVNDDTDTYSWNGESYDWNSDDGYNQNNGYDQNNGYYQYDDGTGGYGGQDNYGDQNDGWVNYGNNDNNNFN